LNPFNPRSKLRGNEEILRVAQNDIVGTRHKVLITNYKLLITCIRFHPFHPFNPRSKLRGNEEILRVAQVLAALGRVDNPPRED
jgi:hypothetical protein